MIKAVLVGALALALTAPEVAHAQAAGPPHRVGVFIQAYDEGVVLEEQTDVVDARGRSRGRGFLPACVAPCRLELDTSKTYRIAGPDVVASRTFKLPLDASSVAIEVKEGHVSERVGGVILTSVGGSLTLIGFAWFVLSSLADPDNAKRGHFYGGTTLLVGVGALVPGIMLLRSSKTRIKLVPGPPSASGPTAVGSSLRWEF